MGEIGHPGLGTHEGCPYIFSLAFCENIAIIDAMTKNVIICSKKAFLLGLLLRR